MKKTFLFLISFAALVVSCEPAPQLSFEETLDISSDGGDVTVDVTSNYPWTAEPSVPWVQITSSGGGILGISISANETYDSRMAEIKISCKNIARTLTITQNQKDVIITDGDSLTVGYDAQDIVIQVQGNVSYQCEVGGDASSWLHLAVTKGMVSSRINLHADENVGKSPRLAKVVLQNAEQTANAAFTVKQEGTPSILKVTHSAKSFVAPTLNCSVAQVYWGDGEGEKYKANLSHSYAEQGTYCVTVTANDLSVFVISSLVGVESVDISGI